MPLENKTDIAGTKTSHREKGNYKRDFNNELFNRIGQQKPVSSLSPGRLESAIITFFEYLRNKRVKPRADTSDDDRIIYPSE